MRITEARILKTLAATLQETYFNRLILNSDHILIDISNPIGHSKYHRMIIRKPKRGNINIRIIRETLQPDNNAGIDHSYEDHVLNLADPEFLDKLHQIIEKSTCSTGSKTYSPQQKPICPK